MTHSQENGKQLSYWIKNTVLLGGMIFLLVGSALLLAHQVYVYRQDFSALQKLKKQHNQLNMTRGRLLIEQQTFGATAQIGTRAVTQLRMYSPPATQTVVIHLDNLEK